MEDALYGCYLRVGDPGPWADPWAGIARLEMPSGIGRDAAVEAADRAAGWLPGFASALHRGADTTGMGQAVHSFLPRCLTYEGHDFLEDARNDTRWKRAKDALAKLGGPMTVAAFRTVLQQITATDISKLGSS